MLRARNGFSVLKSVCRLRLKKTYMESFLSPEGVQAKVWNFRKRKCGFLSKYSLVLYNHFRGREATDTEVNNCFSIYWNSEIIEHKNMIFNSFTVANDYNFGAQWPNGRGRHFFLLTNKTFDGIYLARAGKSLQKELWILFVFKIIL